MDTIATTIAELESAAAGYHRLPAAHGDVDAELPPATPEPVREAFALLLAAFNLARRAKHTAVVDATAAAAEHEAAALAVDMHERDVKAYRQALARWKRGPEGVPAPREPGPAPAPPAPLSRARQDALTRGLSVYADAPAERIAGHVAAMPREVLGWALVELEDRAPHGTARETRRALRRLAGLAAHNVANARRAGREARDCGTLARPAPAANAKRLTDAERRFIRREYLPGHGSPTNQPALAALFNVTVLTIHNTLKKPRGSYGEGPTPPRAFPRDN